MSELLIEALTEQYGRILACLDDRGESDFDRPTRAARWTVKELLFHQCQDAVRALVAFADVSDDEADVDSVSYWRPFRPGSGGDREGDVRFVQASAGAYEHHRGLLRWWAVVSHAAVSAARHADAGRRVRTQGHVLTVADFVSTLLVESTIHHLDLVLHLSDPPRPSTPVGAGLAETRRVLEGLLGAPLPTAWDDTEAALKGTGRVELTDADRAVLGDRAAAVPLLG